MQVLIDTNFMMIPVQFNVDIYEELKRLGFDEIITLDTCVKELEHLAKNDKAAKTSFAILKEKNVNILSAGKEPADDAIVEYVKHKKIPVGTQDRELIKTLKSHGIMIIRLRQQKYLIKE
ncbi:PIN domain-containing protein [Candidatus Aenigmatarchaeota archaeon]